MGLPADGETSKCPGQVKLFPLGFISFPCQASTGNEDQCLKLLNHSLVVYFNPPPQFSHKSYSRALRLHLPQSLPSSLSLFWGRAIQMSLGTVESQRTHFQRCGCAQPSVQQLLPRYLRYRVTISTKTGAYWQLSFLYLHKA